MQPRLTVLSLPVGKDADEEKGDDGHDGQQNTLIYVSGVAAVVLLVILVYAVMDTADSSQTARRPGDVRPGHSAPRRRPPPDVDEDHDDEVAADLDHRYEPHLRAAASPSETAGELTTSARDGLLPPTTTVTMTNPYATTSAPNAGRT